jgi:hypothetical protein
MRTSGRSASALKRIRAGRTVPGPDLMVKLVRAAREFAWQQLRVWNLPTLTGDLAACYAYLAHRKV